MERKKHNVYINIPDLYNAAAECDGNKIDLHKLRLAIRLETELGRDVSDFLLYSDRSCLPDDGNEMLIKKGFITNRDNAGHRELMGRHIMENSIDEMTTILVTGDGYYADKIRHGGMGRTVTAFYPERIDEELARASDNIIDIGVLGHAISYDRRKDCTVFIDSYAIQATNRKLYGRGLSFISLMDDVRNKFEEYDVNCFKYYSLQPRSKANGDILRMLSDIGYDIYISDNSDEMKRRLHNDIVEQAKASLFDRPLLITTNPILAEEAVDVLDYCSCFILSSYENILRKFPDEAVKVPLEEMLIHSLIDFRRRKEW